LAKILHFVQDDRSSKLRKLCTLLLLSNLVLFLILKTIL
jgi:hypothetical protein